MRKSREFAHGFFYALLRRVGIDGYALVCEKCHFQQVTRRYNFCRVRDPKILEKAQQRLHGYAIEGVNALSTRSCQLELFI
jgi:hypothetical protein